VVCGGEWCRGILWFVVGNGVGAYCGLWWGMNQLIALGIDGRIIKMKMQEMA
jgi:hypothetical protein